MAEAILAWLLIIYAMFENEPLWGIAAAIFAVATQMYQARKEG